MRRVLMILMLAGAIWGASIEKPRVKRGAIVAMEKSFDQRIQRIGDDPFLLLGDTRGIYLEGFGAVFTAEVNLVNGPTVSPFRPAVSKEDVAKVHARKLERLPALKQSMRDMLLAAAATLDEVPAAEQIAVGVTLLYLAYEDTSGLPGQILMQAPRGKLLDAKFGRASIDGVVRVQEY